MIPSLLAAHDPLDHVLPHRFGDPLKHWGIDFQAPFNLFRITPHDTFFTNQMLMSLVAAALMLAIFPLLGRRYAALLGGGSVPVAPRGMTNLLEAMMQFVRNDMARPVLGHRTDRFMPFLWTVFFYILICNLLGMIPFDSLVYFGSGYSLKHIGGTATGNIMITAGLAACAFFMIHFSGTKEVYLQLVAGTYGHHDHHDGHGDAAHDHAHGAHAHSGHAGHHHGMSPAVALIAAPLLYIWNFAPHVFKPERIEGVGSLVMWVLDVIMWVILLGLELIGAVIKPFALAIRLFANMIAGHVVLSSILGLIFAFKGSVAANLGLGVVASLGAAALNMLELFVCFLQAYVFTFLTTLFIGAAVAPEH